MAITPGFGTRGFFGSTRSIHTHRIPFGLPQPFTEKAKRSSCSIVAGSDNAMRRSRSGPGPKKRSPMIGIGDSESGRGSGVIVWKIDSLRVGM
jgi:hypothetical protein